MPETVVHAMAGQALFKGDVEFALSVLLVFYAMMRTGEILNLDRRHVEVSSVDGPAIISLGLTKGGKRQGAAESITVTVFDVVRRLHHWKANSKKPLTDSPSIWRGKFSPALSELGLDKFEFI